MAQNVIIEAISGKDIGRQVAVVVQPVVRELLGTKNKHRPIPQLVIFHNGQSGKCFTKPHAVGQDAAAVGFELVDDAGGGITLKVEELVGGKDKPIVLYGGSKTVNMERARKILEKEGFTNINNYESREELPRRERASMSRNREGDMAGRQRRMEEQRRR